LSGSAVNRPEGRWHDRAIGSTIAPAAGAFAPRARMHAQPVIVELQQRRGVSEGELEARP
jgi:hypothetical protein